MTADWVDLPNKFLQEIFQNEEEYSFLDKIYDSSESGYNTHIKIFEINYDLLLEQ